MDIKKNNQREPIDLRKRAEEMARKKEADDSVLEPIPVVEKKSETSDTLQNMWDERDAQRSTASKRSINTVLKHNLTYVVIGVVVVVMIILASVLKKEEVTEPAPIILAEPISEPVVVVDTLPFEKNAYYGLATAQGELYFAHITDLDEVGYHLADIYYEQKEEQVVSEDESSFAEATADNQNNSITLVKFGTEAYEPEDNLVVPKEQVTQLFPLGIDSPILAAINAYTEAR